MPLTRHSLSFILRLVQLQMTTFSASLCAANFQVLLLELASGFFEPFERGLRDTIVVDARDTISPLAIINFL